MFGLVVESVVNVFNRACGGSRTAGDIYAVTPIGPGGGIPFSDCIVCSPVPVLDWDIPTQGVTAFERDGVMHVLDHAGEIHYPNVLDYLEETRRMGVSRKIPKTFPFERLSRQSRLFVVHSRGVVDNWPDYQADHTFECEAGKPMDHSLPAFCSRIWRYDVDPDGCYLDAQGGFWRSMKAFSYQCYPRPDHLTPRYTRAIVARFPIWGLEVVAGNGAKVAAKLASRAEQGATVVNA